MSKPNSNVESALGMIISDWERTKDGKLYKPSTTRKTINTIKAELSKIPALEKEREESKVEADITFHTLINQKEGTVTMSSDRYDKEERELIDKTNKLNAIEEWKKDVWMTNKEREELNQILNRSDSNDK